jgi:arginyl-tRNA synthetase
LPSGDAGGDPDARLKVIVRSNGTVTYVGKDIAYQLWKFGLLGRDFHYRPFDAQASGRSLWTTSSAAAAGNGREAPRFGRAAAVYNVIDTRQSYLQRLLAQALAALDHPKEAERSIHFSYEMVALSRNTARALGHGDDDGKAFVEVSGRKGLGVKADDLLDQVTARAEQEVAARHPDLAEGERRRTAAIISTAAVRYFMIKFSRGKVIAFDIDEALSFEGETGPYLQYAAVRARKILQKLHERTGLAAADIAQGLATTPDAPLADAAGDELWGLVLEASRLDEVADQAVRTLELSVLAKYAFGLAQRFNGFYHSSPVVAEADEPTRLWRAAGVAWFEAQMTRALALMGCEVPDRM